MKCSLLMLLLPLCPLGLWREHIHLSDPNRWREVVVDAVDSLVNDCADTGCDNTFSTLETKLQTLLKGRYHFDFVEKLFPPLANRLSSSRED
eukprot:scaffold4506_cov112-Alexandrium_tamarense.AAC.1